MTRQRTFKRSVRDRMQKTGESYTAARRQLLSKSAGDEAATADGPSTTDQELALGLSDEAVLRRTGRGWQEWLRLLDGWGATERKHSDIARWLVEEHDLDGWSAQSVTVGYERARGMRAAGQRSDGYFTASVSKTIAAPAAAAFAAFTDDAVRTRWLPDRHLEVRTARADSYLRADWDDGSSRIVVGVIAKAANKCQVAVQHERLPDGEATDRTKVFWRERLAMLKAMLEADPAAGGTGQPR